MFMAKKTKGIVALPLFLLFLETSPVSNAQNRISLAVGQSYTLPAPTHFGARIYSAQWSCQTTDVSAQTLSDFSGRITVVRAFTGDVRVTCYYSYSYTINGFSYTGTSAEYYLVECSSGGGGGGGGSGNETGVSLDPMSMNVNLNNPYTTDYIGACALPAGAQSTFTWTSTNPSVATVKITSTTANCSNGYIVANSEGTCYIKVTTANGYTEKCLVTVTSNGGGGGGGNSEVTFVVNGITYKKLTNTTCEVTYNDSGSMSFPTPTYSGNISIPSQVSYGGTTYNVTAIGGKAFYYCSSLTSVIIPSSVTTIGDYAFRDCSSLTSVIIPSSVTTIGNYAFSNCSSLTSVTIPSSVTTIGGQAFSDCTSLKVIFVSSGNTKYSSQDGVLYNINKTELICCPGGYSGVVKIPNSVTTIGNSAFYNCSSLTSVTIPSSVTTIGNYAFGNCRGLASVTIPNAVTTIGYKAFYNVKMIYYQGSASGQPWGALCMNGYLEDSLYYSNSLKTNLISAHSAITKALIPNTVTTIGDYAFYNCSALASVTIPSSVTTIGNSAFSNCTSLKVITVSSGNTKYSSQDGILYDKNKMELICCPGGKEGSIIIPSSVKRIDAYAFRNCTRLTSVTIPSSVTFIDSYVFDGCQMAIWMKHTIPLPMIPIYNSGSLVFVVPHKAYKDYLKAGINYTRHRICCDTIMVTATVNDKTSGYIVGVDPVYTFPYANPLQIELKAEPYQGRCFVQWNDGDTTNPRLVTLLCDTSFTAYFQGVGVSEAENGDVPFAYAESGCIVVKNLQHPEPVEISDVTGRRLFRGMVSETSRIPVRASAVYFVRIGGRPAQKVVLIR